MWSRVCIKILLALPLLSGIGCSSEPGEAPGHEIPHTARYAELRKTIKHKFHFSVDCVCVTSDPNTVKAKRKHVTEKDMPVLVELLGARDLAVATTACAVLQTFQEAAIPLLHEAAQSSDAQTKKPADVAIALVEAGAGWDKEHGAPHGPVASPVPRN